MVKKIYKFFGLGFIFLSIVFFYSPLNSGKLPIPSDTIVGLYHPYRDLFASSYPNGIPFKNFLITDPVRQTYVWKELSLNILSAGKIPVWNPYEMSGKPLLANFQSSVFYPLNLIFLIYPFSLSWSIFILLQTTLSAIFMYLYLSGLKLKRQSAAIGSLVFCFCSFSVSWLEWGNIGHTALWLPLSLFAIDKIFSGKKVIWYTILTISFIFSFLAGHLQTFFYLFLTASLYFLFRFFQNKKQIKIIVGYVTSVALFLILVSFQLVSTINFLLLSSRSIDQNFNTVEGWFIPWRHLIQIIAPDFFGNPTTLNYWGAWNYGELTIYVGILPLILSFYSIFQKGKKEVLFYWIVLLIALLFALPTVISSIPYLLNIPFISSAQPTRLIFIITFALSVLSAFGFDYVLEKKKINIIFFLPILFTMCVLFLLWILVFVNLPGFFPKPVDVFTSKRNLLLPTLLFGLSSAYLLLLSIFKKNKFQLVLFTISLFIVSFDLIRFAQKFTPFTPTSYLFPSTKIINYLQNQKGVFRVASLDRRIMPPNFFTHYKIQTIEGYDPIYLKNYAEFITAMERGRPDITPPFGFNRIITPNNYSSPLFDLLNVKYVLSFDEIKSGKLVKIMEEGKTKLYENKNVINRAFFVKNIITSSNDIGELFKVDAKKTAVLDKEGLGKSVFSVGNVKIDLYQENEVKLSTENTGEGFLVLMDVYYPGWKAYIDGEETRIYQVNHAFRGILVPSGKHNIIFSASLL